MKVRITFHKKQRHFRKSALFREKRRKSCKERDSLLVAYGVSRYSQTVNYNGNKSNLATSAKWCISIFITLFSSKHKNLITPVTSQNATVTCKIQDIHEKQNRQLLKLNNAFSHKCKNCKHIHQTYKLTTLQNDLTQRNDLS